MYSNADKHALAVNMRDEEGWNIVRDLIASADVIVQNMKPGSLDRLGFGWKDVQKFNPRMVCVGISGFGDDSAYQGRPAVDTIVQGGSGIMDLTRDGDVPLSTGISYSDITGGQLAMLGVVAGLELRERTGKGMNYDISMQDVTSWVTETTWNIAAEQRGPNGAAVECSDGYVWMENPADADGIDTASKTRAAMFGGLAPKGVKLAPILNVSEAAIHPQTLARALIVDGEWETGPWPLLGSPMKLSKTPPQVRRPINRPEAPTAEVLAKFGIRRNTAAGSSMRAVWYEKQGPAREVLILGEKPTPAPSPGEVLIRVYASGVNPSDEGMRSGLGRAQNVEPFVIPQSDGAGIVEALGDGVTRHTVGDRVWLYNGQREGRQHGTGAEFIALNAERVRPCPKRFPSAKGQLSVFPV